MKDSITKTKSFAFAVRVVKLYSFLSETRREFVISKQCLRSGTAIGAMIRESEYAQSKADFIHKWSIGIKEANETLYWLELLHETRFIDDNSFVSMKGDVEELLKLMTAGIKTAKSKLKT
jgi:four helix bundle protein